MRPLVPLLPTCLPAYHVTTALLETGSQRVRLIRIIYSVTVVVLFSSTATFYITLGGYGVHGGLVAVLLLPVHGRLVAVLLLLLL